MCSPTCFSAATTALSAIRPSAVRWTMCRSRTGADRASREAVGGPTIISDEEPVDFFANIVSGAVKLTKTLPDGRQQIVGLLFAPDFLGRAYSKNNPYTAEAATDVEICAFPNAAFERLVGEYPGLQQRLFQHTLDELDAARDWMLLLGRKTAEEKVASFLFMLARRSMLTGCQHKNTPGMAALEPAADPRRHGGLSGLTIEDGEPAADAPEDEQRDPPQHQPPHHGPRSRSARRRCRTKSHRF